VKHFDVSYLELRCQALAEAGVFAKVDNIASIRKRLHSAAPIEPVSTTPHGMAQFVDFAPNG
jgi:hypothetical protein